jgi:hypothetical protein
MRRTTVFLEPRLIKRAQELARREGKSFAAIVREALAAYVAGPAPRGARLPSIAGRFAGARSDVSERVDELLWQEPHD